MKFADISLAVDAALLGAGPSPAPKRPNRPNVKVAPPVDNGPPPNPNQGGGGKQGHGGQGKGRGRGQGNEGRGRGQGGGGGGTDAALLEMGIWRYEQDGLTAGGTLTAGAYQSVPINAEHYNGIEGASFSANTVILPAGTYEIEWGTTIAGVHTGGNRIYNDTGAAVLGYGVNAVAENSTGAEWIEGRIRAVFTVTTTLSLDSEGQLTEATQGMGMIVANSQIDIFAELLVRKVG